MGVYNNNNGTLTPIANETQFIAPVNEYVTKLELEAIVPSDTSAENKLVNSDEVDDKVNDVWKVQGEFGVKNLFSFPYEETNKTLEGITWTANDDGSITVNGTSTDYSFFDLRRRVDPVTPRFIPSGNSYICSLCNNTSSVRVVVRIQNSTQGTIIKEVIISTSSTITFTNEEIEAVKNGTYTVAFRLYVEKNKTIDNVTIYPMLRYAEDTDNTWHPYAPTNYELMQSDNALAEGLAGFGKKLWQGNFTSGSIEVTGAAKYKIILVFLADNILTIGNHYNGGGSYGSADNYNMIPAGYRLSPTASGDNMIYSITESARGGRKNNAQAAIIAIYGLF